MSLPAVHIEKVASQILLGLRVLHEQMEFIHGDLNPQSILLGEEGTLSECLTEIRFPRLAESENHWIEKSNADLVY
jgi:serine/threonine protein kinase